MKKIILLILALFSFAAYSDADAKKAYDLMKEGKAVLIDVREADEIKSGMIDGAQWFPTSKFKTDPNWKDDFAKQTKGKEVFLYCRSGNRSDQIKTILNEQGMKSENIGGYETLKNILPVKKPAI